MIVVEPLGSHNLLTVKTGDDLLKVSTPPHLFPEPDSSIWLRLEPARIRWMDRETGQRDPARRPGVAARRRLSDRPMSARGVLAARGRSTTARRFPPGTRSASASSAAAGSAKDWHLPAYEALRRRRRRRLRPAARGDERRPRRASRSSSASSRASTSCWPIREVDVVDIATGPEVRLELIARAVEAGKHVLAQKPLALDVEAARASSRRPSGAASSSP